MTLWRRVVQAGLAGLAVASTTFAKTEILNESPLNAGKCSGMYAKSDVAGAALNPQITLTLQSSTNGLVAAAILHALDVGCLGKTDPTGEQHYVCDEYTVSEHLCVPDQIGKAVVIDTAHAQYPITAKLFSTNYSDSSDFVASALTYNVSHTGIYCAFAIPASGLVDYIAVAHFLNPFGEMPGAEYPKLPFYIVLCLVYSCMALAWSFVSIKYRRSLLPVQNYLLGMLVFSIVEAAINWAYYNAWNKTGYYCKCFPTFYVAVHMTLTAFSV